MSELEMAFQLCPRDLIAVTGTIGKRTTVELLQSLFQAAGRTLTIGGNRGRPLSALLHDESASNPIALAVSSFQLETVVHFRPHIAILLNIDEAHLDRHRSIAEYIRIKSRIFMNHRPDDILILPFDDERLRTLSRKHHGRTFFVSRKQAVDRGAWLADGAIWTNIDGTVERIGDAQACPSARYPYPENLLSAAIAARLCGLPAAL
jgi:UDP-N-acetylmuramoylalanine--D-glutamate ligase